MIFKLPPQEINPYEMKPKFFKTQRNPDSPLDFVGVVDQMVAFLWVLPLEELINSFGRPLTQKEFLNVIAQNGIKIREDMKLTLKEIKRFESVRTKNNDEPWININCALSFLAKEFPNVYELPLNQFYLHEPCFSSPAEFFKFIADKTDIYAATTIFEAAGVDATRERTPANDTYRMRRPWDGGGSTKHNENEQIIDSNYNLNSAREMVNCRNVTPDEFLDVLLAGGFEILFPHLVPKMEHLPKLSEN